MYSATLVEPLRIVRGGDAARCAILSRASQIQGAATLNREALHPLPNGQPASSLTRNCWRAPGVFLRLSLCLIGTSLLACVTELYSFLYSL